MSDTMTVNVRVLQDTLDRLTTKIERWNQGQWCHIRGGADWMTDADLEAGRYHDFELTPEFIEWYRNARDDDEEREFIRVPVADCGTSFCVAGDVCVANGYTFVAEAGASSTGSVVKSERLFDALRSDSSGLLRHADDVAADILGLSWARARVMFNGFRSLPEIWGLAFAYTNGLITLPDRLPKSKRTDVRADMDVTVPATETTAGTRRVIFEALYKLAVTGGVGGSAQLLEVARCQLDALDAVS